MTSLAFGSLRAPPKAAALAASASGGVFTRERRVAAFLRCAETEAFAASFPVARAEWGLAERRLWSALTEFGCGA